MSLNDDDEILKQSAQLGNIERPQVAILDFGSQYSHLIARRVRDLHVYCELYSCLVDPKVLKQHKLICVILSGGPHSVYEKDAPHVAPELWEYWKQHDIPVLGICYGMQEMAHVFGGNVDSSDKREYGKATATLIKDDCPLFRDMPSEFVVWMSHGDKLKALPENFVSVAKSENSEFVAMQHTEQRVWGIQFHPEVTHTALGRTLIQNFVVHVSKAPQDWIMSQYANDFVEQVKLMVGPKGHVLGAVSGGVDSTVAAVLMTRAIGDRFHAIMVDNGCLRKDEATRVLKRMREDCGVNLRCIDASERFLGLLKGVTDPERKRKIIGKTFIDVFQEEANRLEKDMGAPCEYLLQGTLYPDVIESISYKGPSATIKTHHNVGGLPAAMKLKLIEPLRELFKDEVRELGMALGIDEASVWRHPFPGPGLAIRILGEVTPERVAVLQEADAIVMDILNETGHYRKIGQAFVVLLPVKTVGVMGDGRTYENAASVRCVETTDYMTADFYHLPYEVMGLMSSRVINEVKGINRLCYDISSKPPATIEWE